MTDCSLNPFLARRILTTDEAAAFLGLKPQTLRCWSCYEKGPIKPVHVGNRLRWRLSDLEALLDKGAY
ncbi:MULTISPECIES: helix-turn-helix transcriptional regulator [Enterobacterales]|uniref:helix-turn-helix transcriptional regulator n=1 Tax=Enterobacterales TaxID=91347 RepID=UPI0039E94640